MNRPVRFGIWGDTPYTDREVQAQAPLIEQLNDADLDLAIFVGDIFGSFCEDSRYADAMRRFNTVDAPLVYVPGDNEWTDCNEGSAPKRDPLERLSYIRTTMFANDQSYGRKPIRVERQRPAYPENGRWKIGSIWFVALNVPGSNNNHVPDAEVDGLDDRGRGPAERQAAEAEYRARDEADRAWLHQSFEVASRDRAPAVVVAFQADPAFEVAGEQRVAQHVDGFDGFLTALAAEAKAFAKPVVVVHGDSHRFVHDQPLAAAPNLIRVETFGSPDVGWVEIALNPADAAHPTVEPRLVRGR